MALKYKQRFICRPTTQHQLTTRRAARVSRKIAPILRAKGGRLHAHVGPQIDYRQYDLTFATNGYTPGWSFHRGTCDHMACSYRAAGSEYSRTMMD
jgi:hypothetical protein